MDRAIKLLISEIKKFPFFVFLIFCSIHRSIFHLDSERLILLPRRWMWRLLSRWHLRWFENLLTQIENSLTLCDDGRICSLRHRTRWALCVQHWRVRRSAVSFRTVASCSLMVSPTPFVPSWLVGVNIPRDCVGVHDDVVIHLVKEDVEESAIVFMEKLRKSSAAPPVTRPLLPESPLPND